MKKRLKHKKVKDNCFKTLRPLRPLRQLRWLRTTAPTAETTADTRPRNGLNGPNGPNAPKRIELPTGFSDWPLIGAYWGQSQKGLIGQNI